MIDSERLCLGIAETLAALARELRVQVVFKASFDKANRTSGKSYRGIGLERGCGILAGIGRELGDVYNLPWLITAYLIANTAITALYGKISDIHGRRTTILIALSLYMAGSLVCALAPNIYVLVAGRVLHGLGGGGLTSTGMVILGDIAAPRDRGKYYGYFSATYTTAGACGPALGGFIAEYLHWSVIFWMNIPLAIIAVALTFTLLRGLPRHDRPHQLDFLSASRSFTRPDRPATSSPTSC